MASVAMTTPSVLAPVVAPEYGFAAQSVGVLVGAIYFAAIVSGLVGASFVARVGAIGLSMLALALTALGMLILATGQAALLLGAAAAIGTGYGLTNPTAAQVLGQHAPQRNRGLFFSVKQTGVPIGVALAGVLIPVWVGWWSWRGALLGAATMIGCELLLLFAFRSRFDRNLHSTRLDWSARLLRPLARVLGDANLRRLGICSFCFAGMQVCFLTFLVSALKLDRGLSLAAAAAILASAQITSIAARPIWGLIADRLVKPILLLGVLGVAMAGALACLGLLPAQASPAAVLIAAMLVAATAVGWNGVFYAGLVQYAEPAEIATITGATQVLTFTGGMIAPLAFAAGVTQFGSYSITFVSFAVAPLIIGLWLIAQPAAIESSVGRANRREKQ